MLEVKNLVVNYGSIKGVDDISFHVDEGEIVTLIGANGAGKTSTLRALSGLNKVGAVTSIKFMGEELTKMTPHQIVAKGLNHVPEGRRIFYSMTVKENLLMGAWTDKDTATIKKNMERAYTLFPRLKERESQIGGTLSGGEQQMLAVARALMTGGKMLLLDEPSMGLAPIVVRGIFDIIQELQKEGMTILLVEQNANMALSIANRAYVLETGKISLEGPAAEIKANDQVRKSYLGA
ncbi:ABC transporter ATP-binding protein [Qiania dongpingensis]|uniref:ABC transporter ATP-binding protein n=1 Tax=Qiania dongpingensis TaxID=2763669 RepID=A0A7G9G2J6_9FIRM|nr:ABC transporter ATP-binding protein [Qiania dongpingensis]QNM05028.1 ABC transporter ATP-binding protein [Qiania dongpingensis]